MSNNKLIIVGAGGHGRVCADIAIRMKTWQSIYFLDDQNVGQEIMGIKIIGDVHSFKEYLLNYDFFVAVGDNYKRQHLLSILKDNEANIINLIHPSAQIGSSVSIAQGSVLMANTVVNPMTKIGEGVILNTSASIDHDNQIGNYVHLSPGVILSGLVTIGDLTWIGSGTIVINNISIGPEISIGAGSLVTKSLENKGIYFGSPVKFIR